MTSLLYTAKDCGCLVLIFVNDAENMRFLARDIAKEAREGRTLHETTKEALPPMRCPEHKRSEAERASLASKVPQVRTGCGGPDTAGRLRSERSTEPSVVVTRYNRRASVGRRTLGGSR